MPPERHARRALAALLLLATLASSASCWRERGLPAPDVESSLTELDQERERQLHIKEAMERDLARIGTLTRDFLAIPPERYAPPFPLSLFRLTAMGCLNQSLPAQAPEDASEDAAPDEEVQPDDAPANALPEIEVTLTEEEQLAKALKLSCSPAALPELMRQIEAMPQGAERARELTLAQLHRVEELRLLRGRLARRQPTLPSVIRQARQQLSEQRAAWRRVASSADARKLDYSTQTWQETTARLQSYELKLNALERAISDLERASAAWPQTLRETLDRFVYELAWVGEPETVRISSP